MCARTSAASSHNSQQKRWPWRVLAALGFDTTQYCQGERSAGCAGHSRQTGKHSIQFSCNCNLLGGSVSKSQSKEATRAVVENKKGNLSGCGTRHCSFWSFSICGTHASKWRRFGCVVFTASTTAATSESAFSDPASPTAAFKSVATTINTSCVDCDKRNRNI